MAKNGLNVRCLCQTGPKPRTGRILGYVAQTRIPRAPIPPATPHFLWFPSLRIAQRAADTPVPVVTWSSRRAGQACARLGRFEHVVALFRPPKIPICLENGPFGDQKWVKNGSKTHFWKSDPGPYGMLKQVFLAHFLSSRSRSLAHGKGQNAFKMGRFGTKNGSKMGEKSVFLKVILHHWGCSNKHF